MKSILTFITLLCLLVSTAAAEGHFVPTALGNHKLSGGVSLEIKAGNGGATTYIFSGPSVMPARPEPNFASFILRDKPGVVEPIVFWQAKEGLLWWTDGDSLRVSDSKKYGFPTRSRTIVESTTDSQIPLELRDKLKQKNPNHPVQPTSLRSAADRKRSGKDI